LIVFLNNDVNAQIKYLVEFFCIFYQLKIKQILFNGSVINNSFYPIQ